ncbi:diguanylate cyclase [Paenibacillus sp. TRM 82003]|nr:diguanylate cyclase [Paenibacillus sp. TRM 82003]
MSAHITMYITLTTTSGVMTVFLFLFAFLKRKEISGARLFMLYTFTLAVYIFAFAFELASDTLETIQRVTVFEYLGIAFAPPLGLLLIMHYLGKRTSRRAVAAMFVIPAITFGMVATNDSHRLFYKSVYFRSDATSLVDIVVGPWYIVHGAYTFACMLAAMVLLVRQWTRSNRTHRIHLAVFILGQFLPMAGAFLYLMGVTPYGMDPVPMVLSVTSALYIWGMAASRLLTIAPIARERIFDSMQEGVLVLDPADRLIDFNQAAGRMLPLLAPSSVGRALDEVWIVAAGSRFPIDRGTAGGQEELTLQKDGAVFHYQARLSPVAGRGGETIGNLVMLIDVTERKRLENQLKQLAYYDGLTNIFNRTHFIHRGKLLIEEARRRNEPVSLLLFDIDYFKRVNDTYGHETGDRLIVHVVDVCKRSLPPTALFARYGGEEFVLALPGVALAEAVGLADVLRAALEAEPLTAPGATVPVTSSFGVAQLDPDAGDTLVSLLRDADTALYEAKRAGRNAVRGYEPEAKAAN